MNNILYFLRLFENYFFQKIFFFLIFKELISTNFSFNIYIIRLNYINF
jgi:hypothetical protein